MLIYIIIGKESCVPKHFRGQTPGEMCRVTRPAGDKTPKRYRERYAIATTDPEKYILSLAKKLDEDITKLLDDNANLSVTKAAVFCAMDYLDEYRKSTGSAENMRSQIQDYIADATRAKLAEDKVKAENEVLRREAAALREQLEKMRNKEARREERAQQAAQQSAAEDEADKAE